MVKVENYVNLSQKAFLRIKYLGTKLSLEYPAYAFASILRVLHVKLNIYIHKLGSLILNIH